MTFGGAAANLIPALSAGGFTESRSLSAQHSTRMHTLRYDVREANSSLLKEQAVPFGRECANGVRCLPGSVLLFRLTGYSNPIERSAFACAQQIHLTNTKKETHPPNVSSSMGFGFLGSQGN